MRMRLYRARFDACIRMYIQWQFMTRCIHAYVLHVCDSSACIRMYIQWQFMTRCIHAYVFRVCGSSLHYMVCMQPTHRRLSSGIHEEATHYGAQLYLWSCEPHRMCCIQCTLFICICTCMWLYTTSLVVYASHQPQVIIAATATEGHPACDLSFICDVVHHIA